MSEQFADQEVADFIASFNALNPPPAAEVGAARLRAETLGRVAAHPPGREMRRRPHSAATRRRDALVPSDLGRRALLCTCTAAAGSSATTTPAARTSRSTWRHRFVGPDLHDESEFDPHYTFAECFDDAAAGATRHSFGAAALLRHQPLAYIEAEVLPRFREFF